MLINNEIKWAEKVFGRAELGDIRRTKRLVKLAAAQAKNPKLPVDAACGRGKAAAEGAHRLVRNHKVDPQAIFESGAKHTADVAASCTGDILALEDTTTLSFSHSIVDDLGDMGGKNSSKKRGWFVHSILLYSAENRRPLGLIEQERWLRKKEKRGQRHLRRQRAYESKESFKWQRASERMHKRLDEKTWSRVVSVCDREADVYEYLAYKIENNQRFLMRASWNRKVADEQQKYLWEHLNKLPISARTREEVSQRGGRKGREANLVLRYGRITLLPPKREQGPKMEPQEMYALLVSEEMAPADTTPLEWLLLTSDKLGTKADALKVLGYYKSRWQIEDWHKAWKTGCRIEDRRQQDGDNLERIAVITAFVSIRLLQLRSISKMDPNTSCLEVIDKTELKCLWRSIEEEKQPRKPPSVRWAYQAIGKLGGWKDSKRNGIVGWQLLWRGWDRLKERVDGYKLATGYAKEKM